MATNNEVKRSVVDDDGEKDDVELNNGNGVRNEEGTKDLDGYKMIIDLTDDDIRGLEFESEKKACDFYDMYAKLKGFAVRKDDVQRDENGNIVVRQLVCNREGQRDKKYMLRLDRRIEPRPMTRTNCHARFRVAYNFEKGKWRVVAFDPFHNHELTPSQYVHLIPKYRRISEADKALVDSLHSYGVRTCHILGFMMGQKGGHTGLGFCKKDLYNYIGNQGRAKIKDGDAFAALCYLQAKADNDEMFSAKFTTSDDGRLENLFWSDGTSRIDFQCFGDVVAFDTTYKKNKYNKPLVIFCGYNHHGETTIFGCALVSDEKTKTYKWVLNSFLEAMFGKHPTAVVTDGDGSMREAIKAVFPNASHRLCSWHLHQNACENVKNPQFLEEFKSLIYAHYTPETFETEWKRIIDDYGLSNNEWVKKVYKTKTMWAGAYMRDKFFCGIRTTSMCEGINSFIKRYVQSKNSIVDFMHNFERAIKEYRHNELLSDFKSFYSEPVLTTALKRFELGASKIFTRKKFREVKNEIDDAASLNVIERTELGNNVMLKMNRFCNPNSKFSVCLDKVQNTFGCECKLFERMGIPCSHIICAMKHEHIDVFPNSLICKRWTKSAKDDYMTSVPSEECDAEKLFMLRRGAMSTAFNRLCDVSCKHAGDYKEAMEGIYNLCEKINMRNDGNYKDKTNSSILRDPILVKTKGAPRKKKSFRKTRRCSHCKQTSHTKRKCPILAARDNVHIDDGVLSGQSDDDSRNFNGSLSDDQNDHIDSVPFSNGIHEGVDKNCDSKRKRKGADIAPSTQDSINNKTSKDVEKVEFSGHHVNMPNVNIGTGSADGFVTPNHTTNIENDFMRHDFAYGNVVVKREGQNGIHEGVDKNCGSKRKRKGVGVTPSTQDSINNKTSKDVKKREFSGHHVNMSNINIGTGIADGFVTPNHTTNIENDFMRHGFAYGNAAVKREDQNATWNYGSISGANFLTTCNGVSNHSVPMFPQFPPIGMLPAHPHTLVYPGRYSVPHYTPFIDVLEEMERSAKMARNRNGNDDSSFNP